MRECSRNTAAVRERRGVPGFTVDPFFPCRPRGGRSSLVQLLRLLRSRQIPNQSLLPTVGVCLRGRQDPTYKPQCIDFGGMQVSVCGGDPFRTPHEDRCKQ